LLERGIPHGHNRSHEIPMIKQTDFKPLVLTVLAIAIVAVLAIVAIAALGARSPAGPLASSEAANTPVTAAPASDAPAHAAVAPARDAVAAGASAALSPTSERTSSSAARLAAAEALPFERSLYAGAVLDSDRTEALMQRKDFDRALAEFEQQMFKDPLAIEQRDAYAAKLTGQLADDPDQPRVSKLVCGVNLCIGAIEAPRGQSFQRWMARQFTAGREVNDIQSMTVGRPVAVGDRIETRFVFSTSPELNAIGAR
jgi:hypothetical protein